MLCVGGHAGSVSFGKYEINHLKKFKDTYPANWKGVLSVLGRRERPSTSPQPLESATGSNDDLQRYVAPSRKSALLESYITAYLGRVPNSRGGRQSKSESLASYHGRDTTCFASEKKRWGGAFM